MARAHNVLKKMKRGRIELYEIKHPNSAMDSSHLNGKGMFVIL